MQTLAPKWMSYLPFVLQLKVWIFFSDFWSYSWGEGELKKKISGNKLKIIHYVLIFIENILKAFNEISAQKY